MNLTWHFWKWSAAPVAGQPSEVCDALARGDGHPATEAFDPAPLLEAIEQARRTLGMMPETWRWEIDSDRQTGLARHVKLTLPPQLWEEVGDQAWMELFLPLDVFGWQLQLGESFPGTLPKSNVWTTEGGERNFTRYEVMPEEVTPLLSQTGYAETVLLMNHRNDFVNVAKAYGRYTVEWRTYPRIRQEPERFSHWRAGYASDPAVTAAGRPVERKFLPAGLADFRRSPDGRWRMIQTSARQYELLTPGDAAFILRAFIRGETRPKHFRWLSMTRSLREESDCIVIPSMELEA